MRSPDPAIIRLERRLERERKARHEAECTAEKGLRALYERQRQLEMIERITAAANTAGTVEEVFQNALSAVCDYTNWTVGQVYRAKSQNGAVHLAAVGIWHATSPKQWCKFVSETSRFDYAPGAGLPGRVYSSRRPAWISNLVLDENLPHMEAAVDAGLRSAFAFPVTAGGEIEAVLEFYCEQLRDADVPLIQLMHHVGMQIGRVVERSRAEQQLMRRARTDALTGLPNRTVLIERLELSSDRSGLALLYMDLDDFKLVNDSLGHPTGDELLRNFAVRIGHLMEHTGSANNLFENWQLVRLGGDEYMLVLERMSCPSSVVVIADSLQKAMQQPFEIGNRSIFVTVSIGVVDQMEEQATANDILRNADLALYKAKREGKGRYAVFDQALHIEALERLTLETDLRNGLLKKDFVVHYQPIVDLSDETITGFEALVRWRRNGDMLVYPNVFIGAAEETGLIHQIGLQVLEDAVNTAQEMQTKLGLSVPPTMSVNLSARQLSRTDIVSDIASVIRRTSPCHIRLEITETAAMANPERATELLREFKYMGFTLALDDFGTGYSSLSCLQTYPLDIVKIDRSFVNRITDGKSGMQMVKSIIDLAHSLGLQVVAEGIETAAHAALLRTVGCDFGQGYLFGRPVEKEAALDQLGKRLASRTLEPLRVAVWSKFDGAEALSRVPVAELLTAPQPLPTRMVSSA